MPALAGNALAVAPSAKGQFGPRRVSRRREQNATHMMGAMTRVTEQLSVAPDLLSSSQVPLGGRETPSPTNGSASGSGSRKNVSLRFPRVPSPQELSQTAPRDEASTDIDVASPTNAAAVLDEVEDLRLQNAVLKKSLAMLQQSVVDSMKGNRQGFQGSGVFRAKAKNFDDRPPLASSGIHHSASSTSTAASSSLESDIEGLRATLTERRNQLRDALAERDEALQSLSEARRQSAVLTEQRSDLEQKLDELRAQLAAAESSRSASEDAREEAESRAQELDRKVSDLEHQTNSLRESLAASEAQAESLRQQMRQALEAAQAAEAGRAAAQAELERAAQDHRAIRQSLEDQLRDLQRQAGSDRAKLERIGVHRETMAKRALWSAAGGLGLGLGSAGAALGLARGSEAAGATGLKSSSAPGDCSWGQLAAVMGVRVCFEAWVSSCTSTREERLHEKVQMLTSDSERLTRQLDEAQRAAAAAQDADHLARELQEVRMAAAEAQAEAAAKLAAANATAEHDRRAAQESLEAASCALSSAEARTKAAEEEVHRLRQASGSADAAADATRARLQELEAKLAEAAEREASLRAELEAAQAAAEKMRQAEAAAVKQQQEAVDQSRKLAERSNAMAADLATAKNSLAKAQKEAKDAQVKMAEANERAKTLQARAAELEARVAALESRAATAANAAREAEAKNAANKGEAASATAELEELRKQKRALEAELAAVKASLKEAGGKDAAKLRQAAEAESARCAAELAQMKTALAEARADAKSAENKVKLMREEKGAAAKLLEAERSARSDVEQQWQKDEAARSEYAQEAKKALEEARQNIRIMVTAPKVCINVGGNAQDIPAPFPFQAIKDSVQNEVMPKYARIFAVGEKMGDQEIKRGVQDIVEKLAATLQSKVYELMPQAEGTCNWDGFGAKVGALSNATR
eukprot:TRINITY_DN27272_c0_g1_i1.p1 TRINITY_DN27272_c0_g1~~TRINITY_DN27272_c0_g1_i1.p1  ORF type:complete len:948 (+),score=260.60 TRINITY_DN27272_c0_g1_i1:56-2845(+)